MEKLRIDKWLWAARFYKTRALASKAVASGRVTVSGERVKPARTIEVGDLLTVQRLDQVILQVLVLSDRRGSAKVAALMYEESEESRAERELTSARRRNARKAAPDYGRRPDKHSRRRLGELLGKR